MIKIENLEVVGIPHAIRGARNPMNSWARSDSQSTIGPQDFKLLSSLCSAGPDHRKFMRMIVVYIDITAPLYWWKEFDTYKVGTVANSCSTMHKIHDKEFVLSDFSHEKLSESSLNCLNQTIQVLNEARVSFIQTKNKDFWWQMIQLLPSSFNQRRTVMLNFEVLSNIYKSRRAHKLQEWRDLCAFIESLPYAQLITTSAKGVV